MKRLCPWVDPAATGALCLLSLFLLSLPAAAAPEPPPDPCDGIPRCTSGATADLGKAIGGLKDIFKKK